MTPMYMLCDGSLGLCDCVALRAAARRRALDREIAEKREALAREVAAKLPKKRRDNTHGSQGMYKKCKCAVCVKGNTYRQRQTRAKKQGE